MNWSPTLNIAFSNEFENFRPDRYIESIFEKVSEINKDINMKEPWKMENKEELKKLIESYLIELYLITINLKPIIPGSCEKILISFEDNFSVTNFFPRITTEQ